MEAPKVPQNPAPPAEGILSSVSNAISSSVAAVANPTLTTPTPFAAAAPGTAMPAAGMQDTGVTASTAASIENVKSAFANMTSVNEHMFYLILAVFIITIVIGYLLYNIITDNILFQQKIEVSGTEVPIICNQLSEFKIDKVLANSNGIKRTYGFWIYINDIDKYNGKFRHIAHLGQEAKDIKNSCPYICLDTFQNKIHIRFAPKIEPASMSRYDTLNEITDVETLINYDGKRCGITIEYVPIQRWVYVVIVVSDINGGLVYTYIDGELIEVEKAKENKLILHELNFETRAGSLFVGGSVSNSSINATGFSGLMSKFTIYNYDLNKNDIYKEYNKGPLNGLLTSMGIVSYGLRNPVYKINNVY